MRLLPDDTELVCYEGSLVKPHDKVDPAVRAMFKGSFFSYYDLQPKGQQLAEGQDYQKVAHRLPGALLTIRW